MDVVLAASEIVPFSKTGGLADVVGALARALAQAGHRVLTVSPAYRSVDLAAAGARPLDALTRVDLGGHTLRVAWAVAESDGVTHAFVRHHLFERQGLYGDAHGSFGDNHLRYALLSRAAIEAARIVPVGGTRLGDQPLFHVHDWQTSLVPVYLNALYRPLGLFSRSPTVLTLHNLAHQGWFGADRFDDLELAPRWMSSWALGRHGAGSLLQGGILQSDQITTVSPTYAREILSPGGGAGLEAVLRHRRRDLHGILNGIDPDVWNPATDPHLDASFHPDDLDGKATCKAALQAEAGLQVDPRVPLVGTVSRLDPQKGVELLIESIPWLVEGMGAQVVVLGSAAAAHKGYEHALQQLAARYPGKVAALLGYSERLAHRIEAGADFFSMPSAFEPCGLNQMYSLRYGTVPIVRFTGGLADTVQPFHPASDTGNGWGFWNLHGGAYREALYHAITTYRRHPASFRRLQLRGMRTPMSWADRLPAYEAVYQRATDRRQSLPA